MHGERETTAVPRTVFAAISMCAALASVWLLSFGGHRIIPESWMGQSNPVAARAWLLSGAALIVALRFVVLAAFILKRKMAWAEVGQVSAYMLVIFVVQVFFGLRANAALDLWDLVATLFFIAGSVMNTGSELQRLAFKRNPSNKGKLFTGGFFRLVRHPNYLGDLLWMSGWALMTRSMWAFVPVVVTLVMFIMMHMPLLTRHMEDRYGDDWQTYAARTKRLIPFVY